MSIVRVDAIEDSAGGNTATVNGIPLRPGVLDPENRIINGAFDFWQRSVFSVTTTATFGPDRWQNVFLGGTVTMSRQSFTLGDTLGNNSPTFFLRQSVSGQTLASHYAYIAQRIEDVRSYAGQTITVLGWARRSSGSGNMGVNLTQGFGTGGASPSGFVNTAGQIVTLSSTWQPFAVTFAIPSVTGKTLGTDGNSFIQINFWTSAGSDLNAGSGSLGLQTIGVDLWGIHIKLGTHTTAAVDLYRQPELGPELARCQRYYEVGSFYEAVGVNNTSIIASVYTYLRFAVTKRTAPAVTGTSNEGTFAAVGITTDRAGVGRSSVVANRVNSGTFTADAEF